MFDIGFMEISLIVVVALVIFGPERLPEVARNVGQWVKKTRRFVANMRAEVDKSIDNTELQSLIEEQRSQITELRDLVQDTKQEVHQTVSESFETLAEQTELLGTQMTDLNSEQVNSVDLGKDEMKPLTHSNTHNHEIQKKDV